MKISNFRSIEKGNLIASFTVVLPSGMEIRKCKLIRSGDTTFIGFHSERFESQGQTKYLNIVHIPDRERNNAFQKAVMEALKPYLESQPAEQPSQAQDIPF